MDFLREIIRNSPNSFSINCSRNFSRDVSWDFFFCFENAVGLNIKNLVSKSTFLP